VYTFIPVKDGWAFIAGYTDPNFGAICRIMGRPELAQDSRFRTTLDRTQPDKRALLRDEIAPWSVNYTASEILAKVLADPGPGTVVFGPVNRPTQTLAESTGGTAAASPGWMTLSEGRSRSRRRPGE
jgi:CoA:oxalate CoA-transferase